MEAHTYEVLAEHQGHKISLITNTVIEVGATREVATLACTQCPGNGTLVRATKAKMLRVIADDGKQEFACPWCETTPFNFTEDTAFTINGVELVAPGEAKVSHYGNEFDEADGEWLCRSCVEPVRLPEGYELDYA
jgi:Zn finger protein HypA/HybF involved in hydrogenase expression